MVLGGLGPRQMVHSIEPFGLRVEGASILIMHSSMRHQAGFYAVASAESMQDYGIGSLEAPIRGFPYVRNTQYSSLGSIVSILSISGN